MSNRRHPGSSRTEASAFAAMPARNSSRRPGRTSIWTIRLNICRPLSRRSFVCDPVYSSVYNHRNEERGTAMTQARIAPATLREFGMRVLASLGVPEADGALVADSLVQADLWGHQSHGLLRLPWYAARLRSGAMQALTDPRVLSDTGPLLLLAGGDGIGQVLTHRPRQQAVERARTHGVGVVGVRNSNHFGTAMYFTRRAARDGVVAALTT